MALGGENVRVVMQSHPVHAALLDLIWTCTVFKQAVSTPCQSLYTFYNKVSSQTE